MSGRLIVGAGARPFTLPARETVTQTTVIYGGKGMGKTNLAAVIAEELAKARLRFAILDPVGVSWGLRHARDGKGAGVDVLILGGLHGDLPIEATSGDVVADFVADEEQNVIIDISRRSDGRMWGQGEKIRFVAEYTTRLYERQGERRRPILQIIDEAGRFVPQNPPKGAVDIAKCIGAIEQLVELGRNVGVGVMLVTQRSARMAKSVSELAECMVAFRTVGPRSVDAILDWFGEHVEKAHHAELLGKLRTLPRGSALVVSPGWLEFEGVAEFRARETFDSSATPTSAEKRMITRAPSPARLAEFRSKLEETVAKAELDDPKKLRGRVVELEKELERAKKARPASPAPANADKWDKAADRLRVAIEKLTPALGALEKLDRAVQQVGSLAREVLATRPRMERTIEIPVRQAAPATPLSRAHASESLEVARAAAKKVERDLAGDRDASLPIGERKVLQAIAQYGQDEGVDRTQLSVLVGYKKTSRDVYIGRLAGKGFVESQGGRVIATAAGRAALGDELESLPEGDALLAWWRTRLPVGELKVLDAIIAEGGDRAFIERDAITQRTGLKKTSRDVYVGRLASRRLVESNGRGGVRASKTLFG